ncbi:MAG: glycosyltransferase family 87 protein [Candidatus Altiarchaeota archaeon]|nr:glycosyltransferase family 87 protein [Candidatus Altiarchaeota archaeon]
MKAFLSTLLDVSLAFLVVAYALSVALVYNTSPAGDVRTGADMACYYFTSSAFRQGYDIYNFSEVRSAQSSIGYDRIFIASPYPPFVALLFTPFTLLDFTVAFKAWLVMNQVFILLCLSVYFLASGKKGLSDYRINLLIFFLFIASLYYSLNVGQVTILMLLLFTVFYYAMKKDVPWLAGVSLGLSTMIKLVSLIVYPYLLFRRKYRVLAYALAADAVILAFSVAVAGWGTMEKFLWQVLVPLFFSTTSIESLILSIDPMAFTVVKVILALAFLILLYLYCKRTVKSAGSRFDLDYAFLIASILMLTPHMVYYNYVYLILPFWILYDQRDALLKGNVRYAALALLLLIVSPTTHVSLVAIVLFWLTLLYLIFKLK